MNTELIKFLEKQSAFWSRWVDHSMILTDEDRYMLKPIIMGIFERMIKEAKEEETKKGQ